MRLAPDVITLDPSTDERDTSRLRRACEELASSGGVIALTPGLHRVETGWTVASSITLSFAPGATLALVAPASQSAHSDVLRIDGDLDAPPRRIVSGPHGAARVAFTGALVSKVFPEWWGAAGEDPHVDADAIESALRAAAIDRAALSSTPVAAIPVCFGGTYLIAREITVDARSEVRFEGTSSHGDPPTFRAWRSSAQAPRMASMFRFVRTAGVSLRGVSFDAADNALACVRLDLSLSRDPVEHRFECDRCAWANALDAQVIARDDSTSTPVGRLRLSARSCRFTGVSGSLLPDGDARTAHVALSIECPFGARVSVERSDFSGFAYRAIRVTGGALDLASCRFETDESPRVARKLAVDIEVRATSSRTTLQATGCVSRSPSFVRVVPRRDGPSETLVTLSAVTHSWARAFSPNLAPPAVIWEDPVDPTVTSRGRLSTLGCSLSRTDVEGASPGLIRDGEGTVLEALPRVYFSADVSTLIDAGSFRERDGAYAYMSFDRERAPSTYPRVIGVGGPALTRPLLCAAPNVARGDFVNAWWWVTWLGA